MASKLAEVTLQRVIWNWFVLRPYILRWELPQNLETWMVMQSFNFLKTKLNFVRFCEKNVTYRNAAGIFPLIMCPCLFEKAKGLKFRSIRSMRNSSEQIFPFVFPFVMLTVENWNNTSIAWNRHFRKDCLHMHSVKQVSSMSARIHKTLNIHVAWLLTHGLNCESFGF